MNSLLTPQQVVFLLCFMQCTPETLLRLIPALFFPLFNQRLPNLVLICTMSLYQLRIVE